MRTLTEQYESLFGADVVVVGVSTDPPETQHRFAARLGVPFRLLSDPDQKVAKKYGVDDESGFIRRSVYVLGPDGKVAYRNLRFDPFDPKAYAALGTAVRSTRPSR
jgi:peroxiredoxin